MTKDQHEAALEEFHRSAVEEGMGVGCTQSTKRDKDTLRTLYRRERERASDYEAQLASIADFANTFCREAGCDSSQTKGWGMLEIKDAIAAPIYAEMSRTKRERERADRWLERYNQCKKDFDEVNELRIKGLAESDRLTVARAGLEELQEIAADWSVDFQGRTVDGMSERQKAVHACVRVIRSVTKKALATSEATKEDPGPARSAEERRGGRERMTLNWKEIAHDYQRLEAALALARGEGGGRRSERTFFRATHRARPWTGR